jgi:hypothetical protein
MQLSPRRLFFGTSTALVLAAIAASMLATRVTSTMGARRQAEHATARLDSALDRPGAPRALALSYLERARLGLGSPFRLIDQAVHDPRLSDTVRHDVAWAIVDRVFDGRVYEIDGHVLDAMSHAGSGPGHLDIIEDVIGRADDPRVGEASIRIAYGLAASNGSTSLTSMPVVAEVAAQVRDRRLAMRDLRHAVSLARADGVDLIDELVHLRAARKLLVEGPVLSALPAADRESAIDMAPAILARIEAVRPGAAIDMAPAILARIEAVRPGAANEVSPSLLDKSAAIELAALAIAYPPLAAIRIPVTGRASTLRADSALARSALPVIAAASNEESLVAAFAFADAADETRSATLRRLMVSAGVGLRAHAQDPVWFGNEPVSIGSVIGRYALKSITFDRQIPTAWRPFYAQMIAGALDDFTRALPGYDPTGLSFTVEMGPLPDSALAMHDPRTHTIRLSAMTPSGTLAHELAHDVDWRAARRLFAKSGGYATDRSQREQSLRLSSSVRGLTQARIAGRGRISPTGSSRPAEYFARSVDWFVADALASAGRSNGFLSAIQDPILSGFATATADAPSPETSRALIGTLTEMTYLPDSMAAGYVSRWASLYLLDPSTIVLRTIDAPVPSRRGPRQFFGVTREMTAALSTGALCQVATLRTGSAQDRLVAMAIDARAKGIIARRERYAPSLARAASDPRPMLAAVAEGVARLGLVDLAPAPFRPRCD